MYSEGAETPQHCQVRRSSTISLSLSQHVYICFLNNFEPRQSIQMGCGFNYEPLKGKIRPACTMILVNTDFDYLFLQTAGCAAQEPEANYGL